MKGKELRISQIIENKKADLVDFSNSSISKIKEVEIINFSGVILNINQLKKSSQFFNFKNSTSPILRIYHRIDSVLKKIKLFENLTPFDALKSGVDAFVSSFYFGYGDELEAENVKIITNFMRESNRISLPIFVDVKCDGPKIDNKNFSDVVKMSITMITEWGGDGILIPEIEESILEELKPFSPPPIFIKEKEENKKIFFKIWKG